jgi:hypothetical protein
MRRTGYRILGVAIAILTLGTLGPSNPKHRPKWGYRGQARTKIPVASNFPILGPGPTQAISRSIPDRQRNMHQSNRLVLKNKNKNSHRQAEMPKINRVDFSAAHFHCGPFQLNGARRVSVFRVGHWPSAAVRNILDAFLPPSSCPGHVPAFGRAPSPNSGYPGQFPIFFPIPDRPVKSRTRFPDCRTPGFPLLKGRRHRCSKVEDAGYMSWEATFTCFSQRSYFHTLAFIGV